MISMENSPVVIAIDGTTGSAGALAYGVEEARTRRSPVTVVHVTPAHLPVPMGPMIEQLPELVEAECHALLATAVAEIQALAPGVSITATARRGSRTRGILDAAADASVLVLGRETRTGLERFVTGTVTAKVAARAACPVVVVPSTWRIGSDKGRVVVGVKSDHGAADLLAAAFAAASARKASLTVLHARQLPDPWLDSMAAPTLPSELVAGGDALLDGVLEKWRLAYPEVTVETQVLHRQPAAASVEAGETADLLVLARRTPDHVHISYLGATARAVVQQAGCPVEVRTATT